MYVNIRIHEKTHIYIYMSSDVEVKYISSLIFCISKDVRVLHFFERQGFWICGTGGNPESQQFPLVPMVMQNNQTSVFPTWFLTY